MKIPGNPNCTACGLHKTTESVCVMGEGGTKLPIMVIGEAPGAEEEKTGKPFQGRAGQLLTEMLLEAGLNRKDFYISNAVQCRPPDNRTPKKKEIHTCRKYWQYERERLKPKFILLLGNVACEAVLNQKGIKQLRGHPIEQDGIIYFPTYHPSFALRDPRQDPVLRNDIKAFAKIVKKGGIIDEADNFTYTIVTEANLKEALRDIERERVISLDCETSGLNPWAPASYITSIGIGTAQNNWCFPLQHTQGELFNKPISQQRRVDALHKAVRKRVKGRKKVIVAHFGKFDTKWVRKEYGYTWHIDFDTGLAHYNLDENSLHGLDILAQRFFDGVDYDIPLEEKHGRGPLKRHCRYLAMDLHYTRKLYFKFRRELAEDEATKVIFEKLTMPVSRMYADVETYGFYLDPVETRKAREFWTIEASKAKGSLDKFHPEPLKPPKKKKDIGKGVNWNSPDQLAEILFNKLGLEPIDRTPGGKNSTSESVLMRLRDKHEIPALILQFREATKNLNTFVDAWSAIAYNDNRIHPSFKVHGTTTGRPSCEEPNLQQTARDPRIRGLIRAPKGWTLVDADLSQIELRLVAAASNDPELCLSYATGVDVHTLTCQRIFNIANPTKEERKRAKAVNFGFVYGMGWRKFIIYARDNYEVEFTEAEAKRIRTDFFRLYHGLPEWHNRMRRYAHNNGYVRSIIGRMRRLPDAMMQEDSMERGEAERQAINSPIQSLASDLNLMAALQLHAQHSEDYFQIVGTVHDAILMLIRDDMLSEVLPTIKAAMENPDLLEELDVEMKVPIIAEIELGPWGNGKKWQEAA